MKRSNNEWVGRKINEWKILDYIITEKGIKWVCECKCGRIKTQKVYNIKSGRSKMCKVCSGELRRKEKKEIDG